MRMDDQMINTADLERNFEARAMIGNIPHFNLYKNVPWVNIFLLNTSFS